MLRGRRQVQAFPKAAICASRMAAGNDQRFQPARLDRAGAGRRSDAPHLPGRQALFLWRQSPARSARRSSICRRSADRSIVRSVRTRRGISTGFRSARPNSRRRTCSAPSGSCSTSGSAISAGASNGISRATIASSRSSSCRGSTTPMPATASWRWARITRPTEALAPYALNFDVMAHELGHLIIYSTIGVPSPVARERRILRLPGIGRRHDGAHRRAALRIPAEGICSRRRAAISTSSTSSTASPNCRRTNKIRLASNDVKLSQFSAGWEDEHALSQPLTGAMFDIGVDIFQELLGRARADPARDRGGDAARPGRARIWRR